MGRPMVDRLRGAGHDVRVWTRSAPTRAALAAAGVPVAADPAAVGREVDLLLVCVFSDEQVRAACLDGDVLTALAPGSVVVVHTTGSPRTVAAIAAAVADRGIEVIDAPVSGGPHDIAAGRITLFLGGSAGAVAKAQPVLASYGDPVLHVGALGAGQQVKLINNAVFAAQIGLLTDAARLGAELGVAEPALLSAMTHGSAAGMALSGSVARGSVAGFAETARDFITKDVAVVRAVAADLGADLGVLDAAIDRMPTGSVATPPDRQPG
jgi:3-hydroxyisobutyrate dehydrogenase-like beta-hydroxyacid dehydrogenase